MKKTKYYLKKEECIQSSILKLREDLDRMPLPEEVCVEVQMSMEKFMENYTFYYYLTLIRK